MNQPQDDTPEVDAAEFDAFYPDGPFHVKAVAADKARDLERGLREAQRVSAEHCAALSRENDIIIALEDKLEKAEQQLAEAQKESAKHYNRVASLLFSPVGEQLRCGDVQGWLNDYVDAQAELATLREQLAEREVQIEHWKSTAGAEADRGNDLHVQNVALAADARRYKWLREQGYIDDDCMTHMGMQEDTPEALDAAIDTALEQKS